jgi:SsrA-binding protein
LHRLEIRRLVVRTQHQGLTLVPLSIYFFRGKAKIELALVKGKKQYDKRHAIAERQATRDVQRALKERSS